MNIKDRTSLENQLFHWKEWDDVDVAAFQFYDITLKVPVGEFPVGHKFSTAFIDAEKSIIAFVDDAEENEYVYELSYSIGKPLSKEKL